MVWLSFAAHAVDAAGQGLPGTLSAPPERTVQVPAGANLQAALDSASPGDTIELPAGATFTGNYVLPQKNGTASITIRTAPVDGQPNASERVTPAHSEKLARIQSPNSQAALRTAPGARHWKLVLLEFGPNQGGGDPRLTGGVHNFKRFLEDWGSNRLNYAGSLINLFNSHNNNGAFKCCTNVYSPPVRNWVFDTTFLDPTRLPPGTPFFQNIQLTGFQRVN